MSNSLSRLSEANDFSLNEAGVFQSKSDQAAFNYTDGASAEKALYRILDKASDLTSESGELEAQIDDWPSEYHLSSSRANLLRALDLSGVRRVLELGCGCGSITRYLGEQSDLWVDAVEGSPSRAALARMRCRGLDQVEIVTANFNEIEIPEAEYDLVLFVGVTEYAGRFSKELTDQEALQSLLALGKKACREQGVILIAIENRLGMKYALGASEDHYALPYVGIDNYPQADGIRTYDQTEWLAQISQAGFSQHKLLLPFPDYKVPTVVLDQDSDVSQVKSALRSIRSRDYSRPFMVGESLKLDETHLWNALAQADTLTKHSNSFMWLIGENRAALNALVVKNVSVFEESEVVYDFPETPQPAMRPQDVKLVEHLNAQITQLESHSRNLEGKVKIMSNSIGWKFLNAVRRLFRKTTL